jgi:outer membrane protein OmpA-like peptidoglycan-associated protein
MRSSFKLIVSLLVVGFFLSSQTAEAQFLKKLKKRAEKAAEEAVIRKTEEKVYKETSKKMDTVLGNDGKTKGKNPTNTVSSKNPNNTNGNNPDVNTGSQGQEQNSSSEIQIYSKFDFVPGDKLLFFDDFSKDYIGDFPSKWNTNGSGEIVSVRDTSDKWFEIKSGYNIFFLPNLDNGLPEEYSVEFDVLTKGLDRQTSSTAKMSVIIDDNDGFKDGVNMANAQIPFCQYAPIGFTVQNKVNGKREIYSIIDADIRTKVLNQPHVSIAVNKRRFRLWVDQDKYVDIPRLISEAQNSRYIKFSLNGTKDGKDQVFIKNLKISEGGLDLRQKLISEGKVSTNGILFDSGSANIQPQSYGIIRQISQVLQQEISMKLNIIGHTDADGADDANLELSKRRADAVKTALMTVYNITGDRLQTEGKGESVPVGDNTTPDGKAQNRRVEFVKI